MTKLFFTPFCLSALLLTPMIASVDAATPVPPTAPTTAATAIITNSGSGTIPGYRISVSPTGQLTSVILLRNGKTRAGRHGSLITPVRQRFFSALTNAGALNRLPTRSRANAISVNPMAVHIYVRYRGQTSPDLREARTNTGRVLYQNVKHIVSVLDLPIPNVP